MKLEHLHDLLLETCNGKFFDIPNVARVYGKSHLDSNDLPVHVFRDPRPSDEWEKVCSKLPQFHGSHYFAHLREFNGLDLFGTEINLFGLHPKKLDIPTSFGIPLNVLLENLDPRFYMNPGDLLVGSIRYLSEQDPIIGAQDSIVSTVDGKWKTIDQETGERTAVFESLFDLTRSVMKNHRPYSSEPR